MAWQEKINAHLIRAGILGISQTDLYKKRLAPDADALNDYLESLRIERKADVFIIPPSSKGGRETRIWRATVKMIE